MIRLMLECPDTDRLIGTGEQVRDIPREEGVVRALHCPACSRMHRYRVRDTVLEMPAGRVAPP